ncbi:P-loop containing nucleoside triphosphate hydrolase protein [Hyaloscypha variabilis F]|uniref:P-loop containing nucleoside triphosphate hydrolase protein n=1 Tax=Hyaloscypha variabilis (strain UAMH 11265 / GT02V1 / F) TaxID=1149755 RepID=A0A2J6QT74_HYAVF|nr:P-loop containing nucleoside triphosphate hydrolase protein [Hyaloscypha variabilis F]
MALSELERGILEEQINITEVKTSYVTLYRHATGVDGAIMAVSALCAIAGGAALPLMIVVFGSLVQSFQHLFQGNLSHHEFKKELSHFVLYFLYLGIAQFVTIYVATVGFIYTGEHISRKIREQYLASILRQNIALFDKLGAGEFVTRITADTNLVQDGMSEKVPLALTAISTFVSAFVIAFSKYWKLAFILTSTIFATAFILATGLRIIVKYKQKTLDAYSLGGTLAEEVLNSMRNTIAFGTQDKLAKHYDAYSTEAKKWGFRMKTILGVMIACWFCIIYLNYGLAFWQGSRYLVAGRMTLSEVVVTMMTIMLGAFSLVGVAPSIQAFTSASSASAKIFSTIDRISPLDPSSPSGKCLDEIDGKLEFKNITHVYPSRPEVVVMENFNLVIPAGERTAIVGISGSGKSTLVHLLERFYLPIAGQILLDGHDISTLNLKWIRQQLSLVSQEPTLFGTTIYSNIQQGLIGTVFEHESIAKQSELILNAAKMSNAHDFITGLPQGYETQVGEQGMLLSGGQKQRIAIARAIVGDPKILILDEATSALDTESEKLVQAALEAASHGRTTITIAHRLSTIRTADNIVVIARGKVVEQGTHQTLFEKTGVYHQLIQAQSITEASGDVEQRSETPHHSEFVEKPVYASTQAADEKSDTRKAGDRSNTQYSLWTLIRLVGSFNQNEMYIMIFSLLCSIICGCGNPAHSLLLAEQISALSLPPNMYFKLRYDVDLYSSLYIALAVGLFMGYCGQGIGFAYCSEQLIYRVRSQAFRAMLKQDVSFFDQKKNMAGSLTAFLSTETAQVALMSGVTLGTILIITTTLVAAVALALSFAWKLALVCISVMPIIVACGFFRFWILARFQTQTKASYQASASYASEAISAIQTVAALTREDDVCKHYHSALLSQSQRNLQSALKSSLLYAASQSFVTLCMALGFYYGGTLIADEEYTNREFLICFSAIMFGAQAAGAMFSFAPDMGKAKKAAQELKVLFDSQPEIESAVSTSEPLDLQGGIEFRDVHFAYPSKSEQPVLRGLSFTVKPGQYVALVGASGCGKTTAIALLERFYNPTLGAVFVDDRDISMVNINEYRKHLALVSQEPTLYQGNIRENILLGTAREDVDEEEVVLACKEANINDFIMSLPEGFSTMVGSKGTMLSGGEKQRIAIARALLRRPKILLLDEATSALDSESEHQVQTALDAVSKSRTTIVIAHRLSTIQNADMIYVIDAGRVIESGTHSSLLHKKGRYFEFVSLQKLEKMGA